MNSGPRPYRRSVHPPQSSPEPTTELKHRQPPVRAQKIERHNKRLLLALRGLELARALSTR